MSNVQPDVQSPMSNVQSPKFNVQCPSRSQLGVGTSKASTRLKRACTLDRHWTLDFGLWTSGWTLDFGRFLWEAILQRMPKKTKSNIVKVGLIQMSCDQDPDKNLKKAIARIGEAAKKGAQIVCLQELFRSQYFCQTEDIALFKLAETIPGPTTEALGKVAKQHKVVIVASLFEKRAAGVYHNTAVIIDANGKIAGKYRKMHIPDDPLYYEKFYFTPGDLGFQTHDTRLWQSRRAGLLGPMVSRGRALDGLQRRAVSFLSHCHRLAS